jgi:raffinose/stachyose/melibiose transport system substrate-binding protein
MLRKTVVMLCFLLLGASLFAAGGSEPAAAGKKVTLEFWHARGGAPQFEAFFEAYEKLHPNVTVNQTIYVDDDYKTQSRIALSSGKTPDVWYTNTGESLKQFVDAGGLMDIAKAATAKGWLARYDAESVMMCSIGDKLYGLPFSTYTPWMVVWANKNFFKQNNLPFPKTVDDMIALAEPIRKLGQEPLVFYNKDGWTGAILFGEFVLQQVGKEFITDVNSGKLKWTDSAAAKVALDTLARMAKANVFMNGYATQRQDTAILVWKDKKSPLLYNGTWFIQVSGKEFDFEVETLVMPLLTATTEPKAYQNWVDWTVGVCPNTKNPEAALDFAGYAASEDYFKMLGNWEGNITPCVAVNAKVALPYYFKTAPITKQIEKPKTPFFCWAFPLPVIEALQNQVKLVLSGDTTSEAALKAIEAEHQKYR